MPVIKDISPYHPTPLALHAMDNLSPVHCGYLASVQYSFPDLPDLSIHLHRVVSIEGLALRLDGHTSAATGKQLPPDLRSNLEVTVGEQQVQQGLK